MDEKNLTQLDKEIIKVLQGDFPLCEEPYKVLAEKVGISEEEFLNHVKNLLRDKGILETDKDRKHFLKVVWIQKKSHSHVRNKSQNFRRRRR